MELEKKEDKDFILTLNKEELLIFVKSIKASIRYVGREEYSTLIGVPFTYGLEMEKKYENILREAGVMDVLWQP